jgi:hypothetical protein
MISSAGSLATGLSAHPLLKFDFSEFLTSYDPFFHGDDNRF